MVSFAVRRNQQLRLGRRKRIARLSIATRLIALLLLFVVVGISTAQIQQISVELATITHDDEVLLHVRTQRGQTIESAELRQGDNTLVLEAEQIPLPITQWIVLDASDEMINLQSAVLSAVQRFVNNDNQTGIVIYNSAIDVLQPTDNADEINNFLADYTATAEDPNCLAEALVEVNAYPRDLESSWRILVITAGDLSRQAQCGTESMPVLPAPVELIAATDDVDTILENLVANSGGTLYPSNLRQVENQINNIRILSGYPTYTLRAAWDADFDAEAPLELYVTLSTDTEATTEIELRTYNVPLPPEPTAEATELVLATIPPRATNTPAPTATPTEAAAVVVPPDDNGGDTDGGGDNIALLLILGALLFIGGAVVLAIALSRVRRAPAVQAARAANFYQTLDDEVEEAVAATRIRERSLLSDDDIGITHMSTQQNDRTDTVDSLDTAAVEPDVEDEMIITQVLSDDRFQKMMEQSRETEEIVGWMRLEGATKGDFELKISGAVIGRGQDCDIQIKGDSAISRQHARLDVQDNHQVFISRLSGVNPVLVGGIQIGNRHPLKPNDVVHLSDETRLIFIAKQDDDEFDEESTQA